MQKVIVAVKLFLSGAAKADLKAIGRYTQSMWGVKQRDIYLGNIFKCLDKLVKSPLSGKRRDEIYEGMRSVNAGRHVIYHYYIDKEIIVAGILHGQMEPMLHMCTRTKQ
jgi:toxin ParE1/3/4